MARTTRSKRFVRPSPPDDPIKHVVVLMLENRSFDHFLGVVPGVDGIDATKPARNYERPGSKVFYEQTPIASFSLRQDPPHDCAAVLRQIDDPALGTMGGFVHEYTRAFAHYPKVWPEVMAYFPWKRLPALHTLAEHFCVSDRWFSSVPGPTWTNRFFAHSGTSKGRVEMPHPPIDWNLHVYDQDTVYDRLNEKKVPWRIYYGDIPQSMVLTHQWHPKNLRKYRKLPRFFDDVATATSETFPSYVFIEPHYFWSGQNDQHPPNNVLLGDDLIGRIYDALRDNDSLWESTLLIVTYDEHGGFFDHVPPPAAKRPDGYAEEGFGFRRAGVRVPAVLVSKWIAPGVFRPADEHKLLDHTSVLRYLTDKFGLGPLGRRTAAAASIADAIAAQPIEDAPRDIGASAALREALARVEAKEKGSPLNENQRALLDFAEHLEPRLNEPHELVGARAMRAAQSVGDRIAVACERVDRLVELALEGDLVDRPTR
jgi:phospholipase C